MGGRMGLAEGQVDMTVRMMEMDHSFDPQIRKERRQSCNRERIRALEAGALVHNWVVQEQEAWKSDRTGWACCRKRSQMRQVCSHRLGWGSCSAHGQGEDAHHGGHHARSCHLRADHRSRASGNDDLDHRRNHWRHCTRSEAGTGLRKGHSDSQRWGCRLVEPVDSRKEEGSCQQGVEDVRA